MVAPALGRILAALPLASFASSVARSHLSGAGHLVRREGLRAPDAGSIVQTGGTRVRLFCFAWTSRRPVEEAVLDEVKMQFARCDGSALFSDTQAPGPEVGLVTVDVPRQSEPRNASIWLHHKNMAGLVPAWAHLFEKAALDSYDWVINTELDHFVRPSRVREGIEEYMRALAAGSETENTIVGKAMMLMWGNAFLFNSRMVQEMRRQWPSLSRVLTSPLAASGCPAWIADDTASTSELHECAQDVAYPRMVAVMDPPVLAFGKSGCGQKAFNGRGEELPLACWQLVSQGPSQREGGRTQEEAALEDIRRIAAGGSRDLPPPFGPAAPRSRIHTALSRASVGTMFLGHSLGAVGANATLAIPTLPQSIIGDRRFGGFAQGQGLEGSVVALNQESEDTQTLWQQFLPSNSVPIFHEVKWASAHRLARELLHL